MHVICHMRRRIHPCHMSYEEEDRRMAYEEEDTCMSYKEEDTCMSYEEEDTWRTQLFALGTLVPKGNFLSILLIKSLYNEIH